MKDRYDEGAGILNVGSTIIADCVLGRLSDIGIQGFSATIPASFHQSLVGDDLIDYIGQCYPFPPSEIAVDSSHVISEPDGVVTTQ